MMTALFSGLVAAIVTIIFNVLFNYKNIKCSLNEILSDARHEGQWTGVWTNEGSFDTPDNEELVTLYLDCKNGALGGYMTRNSDDSMVFPTFCANSGFKKRVRFYSYSWVNGKRIGKGDGYIQLVNKNNIFIIDNYNNTYTLFKVPRETNK